MKQINLLEQEEQFDAQHEDSQRSIDWITTSYVTNLVVMQLCQNYNFSDQQKEMLFKESDNILIMLQHAPIEYIMTTSRRIETWAYRNDSWFEDEFPEDNKINLVAI